MRYEVQLARDIRQYLTVEVEAVDSEQAQSRAVVEAHAVTDDAWGHNVLMDLDIIEIIPLIKETKS